MIYTIYNGWYIKGWYVYIYILKDLVPLMLYNVNDIECEYIYIYNYV